MAYIAPNTTVVLMKGVPLSNDYQHTLWFDSAAAQQTYFQSCTKKTYTALSYQRYENGMIKIEEDYSVALTYNYLMFKNSAFENKWFYAFITDVQYDNNNRVNIYYEIDEIQTWLFDVTLLPCTIEREHSLTDNIGDSLTGEPVELGPIITHRMKRGFYVENKTFDYVILVHYAYNPNPSN